MFGQFTEEARNILVSAKREMYELKHPYVGSEHLLLAILNDKNSISKKLKEYNLTYNVLKEEIISVIGVGKETSEWFLYTPLLKRILESAIADSKENNKGEVTVEHLFASLLEEGEGVAIRIMLGMNIDVDSLYQEFSYKLVSSHKTKKGKKLLLEELGIDLTKKAIDGDLDPVIGRDKEIKRVLEILCRRTKNNPLIIGEAGVGKTAIVEELSHLISIGEVPLSLKNKRIISLDMATMVAGTKYRGEFEERMRKVLKEIEDNDDIILFIDEIHTLVGAGGAEGAIDASNIFKPALARGKLRCIGATTTSEYKKYIENDGALDRRFQKIMIDVPSKETVKEILMKLKKIYENFHNVSIPENIIDLIVKLSEKYIYDRNQPDKAIDILDEVCSYVNLRESKELKEYNTINKELQKILKQKNEAIINNNFKEAATFKTEEKKLIDRINFLELELCNNKYKKEVSEEDVAITISSKTKIPVYELLNNNKKVIKDIEKDIKSKIIGQDRAVSKVINLAKIIKLGFNDDNKCYSTLFCGPSGVGKTELAKLFGKNLVGLDNIIKLDMSEFSEAHSVSKIIGAPPGYIGYSDSNNVLEIVRNKPNSVLILDEIEKAHPSVLSLLFQILDESKIKDAKGLTVHFNHTIIIMTSNIGFNDINIGFTNSSDNIILSKLKENFSLPFINRIDSVVIFDKLTEDSIYKLTSNKVKLLTSKYKNKKIEIKIQSSIIEEIVKISNYDEYGARKLDKIIKDKIENQIIDYVIKNKKIINIKTIKEEVTL